MVKTMKNVFRFLTSMNIWFIWSTQPQNTRKLMFNEYWWNHTVYTIYQESTYCARDLFVGKPLPVLALRGAIDDHSILRLYPAFRDNLEIAVCFCKLIHVYVILRHTAKHNKKDHLRCTNMITACYLGKVAQTTGFLLLYISLPLILFRQIILHFRLNFIKFLLTNPCHTQSPCKHIYFILYLAMTIAFIITWYRKFWPGEGTSRTAPHSTPHLTPNYCLTLGAST